MSDGRLNFDTKIDTSGIKKGKSDIDREMSTIGKIADKAKSKLKDIFNFSKKDTTIELNYSAQKPQSFFEDNIKDEEYAIKSISSELENAKAHLAELKQMSNVSDTPQIANGISAAEAKVKEYEQAIADANQRLADNKAWLNERIEIDATKRKVDELQAKLERMNATGVAPSSKPYKNLVYDLQNAKAKLDSLMYAGKSSGISISNLANQFKNVSKYTTNINSRFSNLFSKRIPKDVEKSSASLNMFTRILKRMLIMTAIYTMISTFRKGMQEMAQISPEVNSNMSQIATSLNYLKNAFLATFAPILSFVVPVINVIVSALATLLRYIGMVLSALTGKSTFTTAIKQQKDYAASLAKTGSAAKETEKALASFDEINQLNLNKETSGGAGGAGGIDADSFKEEMIPASVLAISEKLKSLWSDILQIFANLKSAFIEAWNYAGNGERILGSIRTIFSNIYDKLKECTTATVEWSKNLDLRPLLSAVAKLFEKLAPLIDKVLSLFAWFYINIILPLATYVVESVLPAFIDLLSGAFDVFNAVLTVFQPLGQWLWDNFLKPIAEWTGGIIVDVLGWLAEKLTDISNWILQNQSLLEFLLLFVGSFVLIMQLLTAIIGFYNIVMNIATVVTTAFSVIMAFLTSPITLVIALIAALIAVVLLLAKHWDSVKAAAVKCWETIKTTFTNVATWFNDNVITPLTNAFKGMVNGIIGFFEKLANGCISVFESIVNYFVDAINSISFDIPKWLGGGHVGFSLSYVSLGRVSLPRLATGTVVPPNAGEFAAILGDNKTDTEVVTPLETMKQALAEVLAELGYGNVTLNVNGSLAALIRLLKIELEKEDIRKGKKLVTV